MNDLAKNGRRPMEFSLVESGGDDELNGVSFGEIFKIFAILGAFFSETDAFVRVQRY